MDQEHGSVDFDPFAGPAILSTAPSTEPQREIWIAARLGEDASLSFNESVSIRLSGALDREALRTAFADVIARHEALRTTLSADGLTLCVSAPFEPDFPVLDWSDLPVERQEEQWQALLAREVETPFDLELGPLVHAKVVRLGAEDHRAVVTAHHIVCDGWATAVLVKDWALSYNARLHGRAPELPPAEAFSAYARAQAGAAQSEAHATAERYWLGQFVGEIPVLELPYDRPRPHLKTYAARREDVELDGELVRDLKKVGGKLRASLFTVLLAGFKALMYRLSGQEDVVVGIPTAGQSVGGHDSLVGHCVNMLPLRSQVLGGRTFAELTAALRTTMLDAYEHQEYTFGTLLSKLPIARDPSRLPLVSVVFNVDRGLTSEAMGFEGLTAELSGTPRHFENFDLFLNVVELGGKIVLECQYNTDLFDRGTIRRWLGAYELLLRSAVIDPGAEIGGLSIVPQADRELVARWNDTALEVPPNACVHHLVEAQVERTPDAIACEFEGDRVSYRELNERANRLARKLRSLGVQKGALVGLSVERSIDLLVGLLGILKAGGAYVPLDPGYPLDRLAFMLEDSRMPVLVTESRVRADLPLAADRVVCLDTDRGAIALEDGSNLPHESGLSATPEDAAYVIYTSGSTGKPKGVLVAHRGVVNLLLGVQRVPGLTAADVVLAITTLSFDIAVSEVILPLTVGAKIVLVSREVASDGSRLHEVVKICGITFIDATPATYRLLLEAGFKGGPTLKLICTGEAMPRDLAIDLVGLAAEVWNGYGPTETTVWSTFYRVTAPVHRILIGHPVANTQIHVLDSRMQPTPIGVPGELFIAGAGVALGYLNRPDLTGERFLGDPFAGGTRRMYRTGDLGRYLPTGELECLGRNDNQVKLRGYRIELGEIEDALGQHPAVRQAAVIVREDRPGDLRLVGYVALHDGSSATDTELRAHLLRSLPEYMAPASFVRLDLMPLTPSGKINRKALPAPTVAAGPSDAEFVAPRTADEALLAVLWQEALGVPRVSVHDDFFALGGHSLLASQILSRLRRDHGIDLSFRKIFEAPTIARLAEVMGSRNPTAEGSGGQPIPRRAEPGPAPLSMSQNRLWLLEEMDPSQRLIHNLPAAWRLDGPVDAAILQRALTEIERRHDMLRTTIQVVGGQARQVVSPETRLEIGAVDLRDVPEAEREAAMTSRFSEWTRELFDLAQGPLFRSYLVRIDEAAYVYFTLRHNIVWDGWSFDIFLRELAALYAAFQEGRPSPLAELPIRYSDYATWHDKWLQGPEMAAQIGFWRERLEGAPSDLVLPADRPRPLKSDHAGGNLAMALTRDDAAALTTLAHASGATLFTVLFAAYVVMLHRHSGQDEILVGTPVRARNRPEVEDLIGPFINAVVLRAKLDPDMTFTELLQRLRDVTLDAFSHQDMPLELLGSRPPMVRAFFSFQDARTRPPALGGIPVTPVRMEPPSAANDMMLWMMETRTELFAMVNYSTELFDAATMDRFLRGFRVLLGAVARSPGTRLSDLPVASPEDLERAREWGRPEGSQIAVPSVLEAFQAHVARAPDALALVADGATVSYQDLGRRAGLLASRLRACGIGPSSLVAISLASATDRTVALLAVLSAGGAFVLLDPTFPAARTVATLRHLSPSVLLVRERAPEFEPFAGRCVDIGGAGPDTPASPTGFTAAAVDPDAACVVCHFDALGHPEALRISHAALAEGCALLAQALGLDGKDRLLGTASPTAELAIYEACLPLTLGARAILGEDGAPSGAAIRRLASGHAVTCVFAEPEVWSELADELPPSIKTAVIAGQPEAELCTRLLAVQRRVFRVHVLSRAALFPLVQPIQSADDARKIGRPSFPLRAAVLGPRGAVMPIGVPGALHVGRDPAADGGLAATGQRARLLGDGAIELAPGPSEPVELRGHRVDLREIAGALEGHASVQSAFATHERNDRGDRELVAYIVIRRGTTHTETELRRHLRATLPDHLVPSNFVEVDGIPMSATGEVDLGRLPSPFSGQVGGDYVSPRTGTESILAELFREALGVARVGIYDNFFDLGGHSLLCFRVIASIEEKFGKRLSPRVMLLGSLEQVAVELDGPARAAERSREPRPAPDPQPKTLGDRLLRRLKGIVGGS
jgi:amino acid adenylation domain-containing protein